MSSTVNFSETLKTLTVTNPYPTTIVVARYGGTYEGGMWLAFPCEPEELPSDPFDDDVTCDAWWCNNAMAKLVGRGATPTAAFEDLLTRKPAA